MYIQTLASPIQANQEPSFSSFHTLVRCLSSTNRLHEQECTYRISAESVLVEISLKLLPVATSMFKNIMLASEAACLLSQV